MQGLFFFQRGKNLFSPVIVKVKQIVEARLRCRHESRFAQALSGQCRSQEGGNQPYGCHPGKPDAQPCQHLLLIQRLPLRQQLAQNVLEYPTMS